MAIHDKNQPNPTVDSATPVEPTIPQGPGANFVPNQPTNQAGQPNAMEASFASFGNQPLPQGMFDWTNVSGLLPYHVNANPNSASLSQFEKALKEFWDDNLSPDLNIDLWAVDRTAHSNLAVSVLIIAVRAKNEDTSDVAYHTLLIEASVDPWTSRTENLGGQNVEVLVTTSDTYDKVMMDVLYSIMQSRYPKANRILSADAEVIHRHFDLSNEDNLRAVTANAVKAARDQLASVNPHFVDINVQNARQGTSTLSQGIRYNQNNEIDESGLPVRSDVVLETIATPTTQVNQYVIQNQTVISRVTGFVELMYVDTGNVFNPTSMWAAQQPFNPMAPQQVYQANFVITQLLNLRIQTLSGVLLALANASQITENNNWWPTLMPQHGMKNDLHDIGNIGYDIDVMGNGTYGKIPTTPDKFTNHDFMALMHRFFHPGIALSIDIPECGAQTWMYKTIAAAALGDARALQAIGQAANTLTNGKFDQYYTQAKGNGKYFFSSDNTILLGYYTNKEGVRRDIRDLDYLAIAGLAGKKSREEIATYTDSFNSQTYPLVKRLAHRRALIGNYLPNVVYTGKAVRVLVEAAFHRALTAALLECGYHVQPQQVYMDNMQYQRANAAYISNAVANAAASGIFTSVGQSYTTGNYHTRFGTF